VSGFLPAHLICMDPGNENGDDGSVLDMVRAVVMAYPHALEERDNDGNLPLHLAFHTWPPPHCVTSFLVEMHPLAVQARNDYGDVPFHEAVYCYAPTIPDLRLLFEQWPDCVRQRDNRGCVPFFSAAANDLVPEEVLHYLFGLWPDAIHQRDDQGWTPLHVAARKGFVIAVEFLLQQSPEMALAKSAAGRTPLHDAASLGGSATVTRLIVERCPESIREPCHEGRLALHEAASKGNIDVARYLVEQSPDSVRAVTNDGWLPIHFALKFRPCGEPSRQVAMDVVELLLRAFPASVRSTTREGYLPLHVAAGLGFFGRDHPDDDHDHVEGQRQMAPRFDHDLVQILVAQSPTSVRMFSMEGMLPVHYAIARGKSWTSIQYLLETFLETGGIPEYVQYRTKKGTPVLHLAIERGGVFGLELVQRLVGHRRHLLQDTDDNNNTPLHYAVMRGSLSEVWRYLVAQRPQSLRDGNAEGSLPLHVYLDRMHVNLAEAQFLLEAHPGALLVANDLGDLPLHVAVCHQRVPLEVVELLVDARPSALRHKNRDGLLPLHVAAQADVPIDALYRLAAADPESIYHEQLRPSYGGADSPRLPPIRRTATY
jgi:ankyrin repeat protein